MTTVGRSAEQHDTPRPYPRLSEAQMVRMLAELVQEEALGHPRPIREDREGAYDDI
jgi:hypothetical protein